jgi:hypothetical protein
VVKSDLSLDGQGGIPYPVEVIREGQVLEQNLSEHRLPKQWLFAEFLDKYKDDPMV